MSPEDPSPCLLAARVCYERLSLLGEGIEWAEKALLRKLNIHVQTSVPFLSVLKVRIRKIKFVLQPKIRIRSNQK